MKINFDDIFQNNLKEDLFSTTFNNVPDHKSLKNQTPTTSFFKNNEDTSVSKGFFTNKIKQIQKKKINPEQSKAFSQIKHLEKASKIQESRRTKYLYEHVGCQKKKCKTFIEDQMTKSIKDTYELSYSVQKQKKIQQSLQTTKMKGNEYISEKQLFSNPANNIHERLYNQHIRKQFRQSELNKAYQFKENTVKKQLSQTERHYLKNYVSLHGRLDKILNKNQQKSKLYETNPQLMTNEQQKFFKPNLSASKRSFQQTRHHYRRNKQQKHNEVQTFENQTLNTSRDSLNKSFQLVKKTEEHFFKKMKIIFSNTENSFSINPETIELLTDVQFNILFQLLQELQTHYQNFTIDEFQDALRSYYMKLPTKEKQQLRSHETQKSNKFVIFKNHNEQEVPQKKEVKSKVKQMQKYHQKLNTFY